MATSYYITTAISYPNGDPHIGHAYEAIAADVMARFRRAQGRDVRFQTGTDEHGLKMAQAARAADLSPAELAMKMSNKFKLMCDTLEISYDRFIRTTDADHVSASQAIWTAMADKGDLYLDRYEGWYSVRDEAFYDADEVSEGEGGAKLSPQGTPVEWTAEESWFFHLSNYQQPLLDHIAACRSRRAVRTDRCGHRRHRGFSAGRGRGHVRQAVADIRAPFAPVFSNRMRRL